MTVNWAEVDRLADTTHRLLPDGRLGCGLHPGKQTLVSEDEAVVDCSECQA